MYLIVCKSNAEEWCLDSNWEREKRGEREREREREREERRRKTKKESKGDNEEMKRENWDN